MRYQVQQVKYGRYLSELETDSLVEAYLEVQANGGLILDAVESQVLVCGQWLSLAEFNERLSFLNRVNVQGRSCCND